MIDPLDRLYNQDKTLCSSQSSAMIYSLQHDIANEEEICQKSLKHYCDMNNVFDTARQESFVRGFKEGFREGFKRGIEEGVELERARTLDRQRSITLRFLSRSLGDIPDNIQTQINQLPLAQLERLQEALLDFTELGDAIAWLDKLT
jgi:flagellar biosynthesis/type III secretory pathway protein FliH